MLLAVDDGTYGHKTGTRGSVYLVVRHHDAAAGEVEDDFPVALLPDLTLHARVAADMGCDRCSPLIETEQEHCGAFQDVSLPGIVPASFDQA